MSVIQVTTPISRKWLGRKPKHELIDIILSNIDNIDLFAYPKDVAWRNGTDVAFEEWWAKDGKFYDTDFSDVPWSDKRRGLAEYTWMIARKTPEAQP